MSKRVLLIVLAVVVIAALLASPYAIGTLTETNLTEQIELYDLNPMLAADVESYERGWRSSRAVLRFGPDAGYLEQMQPPGQGLPTELFAGMSMPVIVEITHGPVLLEDGASLGTAAVRAYVDPEWPTGQMVQQLLGVPYLFELRGHSGFGTGFVFEGEIPPFEGAFPGLSYNFAGLDLTGEIAGENVEFDALIESAGLQGSGLSAILESLRMTGDYVYRPDRLPLGTGAITLDGITVNNPLVGGDPMFVLDDVSASTTFSENADATRLAIEMLYSAETVALADALTINDAAIGVNARDVDAAAMSRYYALARDPAVAANPEALTAALASVADEILAASPSLSIDPLNFSMPSGDLDATLTVMIDGSALPTGQAMDLQNMAVLMGAVDAVLELTVSKPLAQELVALALEQQTALMAPPGQTLSPEDAAAMAEAQAGLMLTTLAAQGLLVDDGTSYSTTIEFTDGNATANGQPIPLGF